MVASSQMTVAAGWLATHANKIMSKRNKVGTYRERVLSGLQKGMRKSSAGPKKSKLKKVSDKEAGRLKKYHEFLDEYWRKPENQFCKKCGSVSQLTPHHPAYRKGKNLFRVITTCVTCHDWIHANPGKARDAGLLY